MKRVCIFLICLASAGCVPDCCFPASAKISEPLAISALIGEAGGQGDDELLAHAYALKNRGTLDGVYGLKSKWAKHPSRKTTERAKYAWQWANNCPANLCTDPVDGRGDWRSKYDLTLMALRGETLKGDGLYDPVLVGDTYFFRQRSSPPSKKER